MKPSLDQARFAFRWRLLWEMIFLAAGFAAAFHWQGAVELKVLLLLILILLVLLWHQPGALLEHLESRFREMNKQQGILLAALWEMRYRVLKGNSVDQERVSAHEVARELESMLESAERAFDEGFELSQRVKDTLSPPMQKTEWAFTYFSAALEVGCAALIGWIISRMW